MVLLPLVLAGRDDTAFPNAATVDFAREPNRHISFGIGAHLCPGMHLARIELRIFLEEWLAIIPDFTIDLNTPPVTRAGLFWPLKSLNLVWTPKAA